MLREECYVVCDRCGNWGTSYNGANPEGWIKTYYNQDRLDFCSHCAEAVEI